jgi:hypothetical protein
MGSVGETVHVGAGLGDDDVRDLLSDPGDGLQPLADVSERDDELVNLAVDGRDRGVEVAMWSRCSRNICA